MLKRLPDLFYNFSSRPLDSDYLLVKNIWRRAQILVEYKTQVTPSRSGLLNYFVKHRLKMLIEHIGDF